MITIGKLSKKFGLSRSTLLYYDKIGLLSPTGRGENRYRLYSGEDEERLNKICIYRRTGITLDEIREVLNSDDTLQLEKRLIELDNEIQNIRTQQKMIIKLMNKDENEIPSLFTAKRFAALLKSIGLSNKEVKRFHVKLEMASTAEHREFLRFLGLNDEIIEKIIDLSKKYINDNKLS